MPPRRTSGAHRGARALPRPRPLPRPRLALPPRRHRPPLARPSTRPKRPPRDPVHSPPDGRKRDGPSPSNGPPPRAGNPGLSDAALFRAVDPSGFLLGLLGGEPVTCISVVNHDAATAFLGFYVCRPGHRGKGLGWRTWQAGIAHAGPRRIGLDGVVDQQANYAKSGFTLVWRNIRHAGRFTVPADWAPSEPIVPLPTGAAAAAARLDVATFPADRRAFLKDWFAAPGHVGLGLSRGGALAGFGVIRPCREGFKIGPLIAPDAAAAETLYLALARHADGATVVLDTPEPNAEAVALAMRHGLAPVFETARMWTGDPPDADVARLYGVMTFELGEPAH